MPSTSALYLALSIVAAMAALADIAAGPPPAHGYLRLMLLAFIAGGSIMLSALTWEEQQ